MSEDIKHLGSYVTSPRPFIGTTMRKNSEGIYSEKIFGPEKDYRCECGRLKSIIEDKGKVCSKCHVLCESSDLRLTTFGKIKLPLPIFKPPKIEFIKKILKKENSKIIDPKMTNVSSDINRYLAVNSIGDKLKIVDSLENVDGFYPVPLRVTGIYSLILSLKYLSEKFDLQVAKEFFDKKYIINEIKIIPPKLRPYNDKSNQKNTKVNTSQINKYYTNILNLNQSNILELLNIEVDEQNWMDMIHTSFTKDIVKQDLLLHDILECDIKIARYQRFVNLIYQEIDKLISGKEGMIRSSILSRTIEFSARAVITCDPSLQPYQIKVSRKILYKLWHPYFAYYLTKIKQQDYDYVYTFCVVEPYEKNKELFAEFLDWFYYSDKHPI